MNRMGWVAALVVLAACGGEPPQPSSPVTKGERGAAYSQAAPSSQTAPSSQAAPYPQAAPSPQVSEPIVTAAPSTGAPAAAVDPDAADLVAGDDPRALAAGATFGDLVRAARTLFARKGGAGAGACVLRGAASASAAGRFEGEAATIAAALPKPPDDLDELVEKASSPVVSLATRWGYAGEGRRGVSPASPASLRLVPFTPVSRVVMSAPVAALIVTDRGVYLELLSEGWGGPRGQRRPLRADEITRVREQVAANAQASVITAEAGVPVARVREVLGWFAGAKTTPVLAVLMKGGTTIAAPASSSAAKEGESDTFCPNGYLDLPARAGRYDFEATTPMFTRLQREAEACKAVMTAGSGGGRIHFVARVGADGKVEKACAKEDDTEDPALRACVLDKVKAMRFPKPTPAGSVDLGTEAFFSPPGSTLKPLCDR